jgi:hypothetical protein
MMQHWIPALIFVFAISCTTGVGDRGPAPGPSSTAGLSGIPPLLPGSISIEAKLDCCFVEGGYLFIRVLDDRAKVQLRRSFPVADTTVRMREQLLPGLYELVTFVGGCPPNGCSTPRDARLSPLSRIVRVERHSPSGPEDRQDTHRGPDQRLCGDSRVDRATPSRQRRVLIGTMPDEVLESATLEKLKRCSRRCISCIVDRRLHRPPQAAGPWPSQVLCWCPGGSAGLRRRRSGPAEAGTGGGAQNRTVQA